MTRTKRRRSFRCAKFIKLGKLDLSGDTTVIGVELAQKLGVTVGDKVTIYSPGNLGVVLDKLKALEQKKGEEKQQAVDDLREVVLPKELTVTGIFRDRPVFARLRVSARADLYRAGALRPGRFAARADGQDG